MPSSIAEECNNVIRSGWVDKKSMRSFRSNSYARRYMVLDPTRLYHLSAEPSGSKDEVHFEVNLDIINDVINREYHEKGLGKFDIVTPSRHLTIKCPFDEKLLWIRDIQAARDLVIRSPAPPPPSLYQSVATIAHVPGVGKKIKNIFRAGSGSGSGGGGGEDICVETFTFDQARALSELHNFMCSSIEICSSIVTAVFESLNTLSGPERSKASKQLGQVLAMWLGESDDHVENSRRASRLSISSAGRPSHIDILTTWLQIGLVREFKESCSFSPEVLTGLEAYAAPAGTTAQPGGPAGSNIPFRRDNVECLFVLSFIKSVAQNTGMLSTWLMPSLLVISQNPESFMKVKTPAAVESVEATPGGASVIVSSRNKLARSSAEDKYSRSTVTRPDEHQHQHQHRDDEDSAETISAVDCEEEADSGAPVGSQDLSLTFDDFIHLESMKIIDKMKKTKDLIPPSFKLLVSTIFSLTVQTSDFEGIGAVKVAGAPTDEEDVKVQRRYEFRPEHGVYYSSSCAVLFLRLICPALLSPLEWGVLSQRTLHHPPATKPVTASTRKDRSYSPPAHDKDNPRKERKRNVLKRFFLGNTGRNANTSSASTGTSYAEEVSEVAERDQLAFISDMNNNPAAAAIILVAHIVSNCKVEEFWSSSDVDLDNFLQIQNNVVRTVPIEKLTPFVEMYESEQCGSVVDPCTRSTFESAPVRRGLMGLAKDMQRLANLSIAPAHLMEAQAVSVYSRLQASGRGDQPPCEEEAALAAREVAYQVQQATLIQDLYNSLGEASKQSRVAL